MSQPLKIFIGWDPAQMRAWNVAQFSLRLHARVLVDVQRLAMAPLRTRRLYTRPTACLEHGYWDELSDAPMSTGHAIARFFVPHLCDYQGWALFTDGDVLFRADVADLFALAEDRYAVMVVPHEHVPTSTMKMDGQIQTAYPRKNQSSVMLINAGHPAHRALTLEALNTWPGRDLHRFCWLDDAEIGSLPYRWNWLVGHTAGVDDPAIVHFTDGLPDQAGYEDAPYAEDWYATARACGYRLTRPVLVS